MQRDEPEVSQASLNDRIDSRFPIEPIQEFRHLSLDPDGWWSFVMHFLLTDWTGDHLHRAMRVIAPTADGDFEEPAPAGRKQNVVPAEKAIFREWVAIVRCGIDHDRDNALDIPVDGFQATNVDSQTARKGGANCLGVQSLALNFAAFHDVFGECLENSILTGGVNPSARIWPRSSPCW